MAQVIQFPKGKVPAQERQFEKRLEHHREGKGAISLGETEHVAKISTGEQVEINPVKFNSVYEIYKLVKESFQEKGKLNDNTILNELKQSMGIEISTPEESSAEPEAAGPDFSELSSADQEVQIKQFLHKFAEQIYEALQDCRDQLAAIKPESIDGVTVSELGHKGDANFVVATGNSAPLLKNLRDPKLGLHVKENNYGFTVENEKLNFRAMFIYQERLHADGTPKSLEEFKDDTTPDEDTTSDAASLQRSQQANNSSHLGQGGSLAA